MGVCESIYPTGSSTVQFIYPLHINALLVKRGEGWLGWMRGKHALGGGRGCRLGPDRLG